MGLFGAIEGFEWDEGNQDKNWKKHKVTWLESEQVFFDPQRLLYRDAKHSKKEHRYTVIGSTKSNRLLYVTFTIRTTKIRIISARDSHKKEKQLYEKGIKSTKF